MSENTNLEGGSGQSGASSTPASPSAGAESALQERLTMLDSGGVAQPFPRSPKLQRKTNNTEKPSQEQLSRRLEELQAEKSKTEAHIQSLKKRKADQSRTTEMMKQRVREYFESMRGILKQDEQAVLDSLEVDLRKTRSRLDQVLKDWTQHQEQITRSLNITQTQVTLSDSVNADADLKGQCENVSPKKPDASEQQIRLNEERFERIIKSLSSISKHLSAQLQRKTLLLDSRPMTIDQKTCHGQIEVTSEGRGMSFSGSAPPTLEHPLQFDKVCCALGSSPVTAGRSYWEVDVHCCSAWAVGVAYGSIDRKGRDKGAKLGRNRNSWCVEFRHGRLSAWHNDLHVACQGARQAAPGRVGVWVDYKKGKVTFYDVDAMTVLQRFSAAVTPVFDRAYHQFTEPLYPAIRLLRPPENQPWPNHVEFCHLLTP